MPGQSLMRCAGIRKYLGLRRSQLSLLSLQLHHSFNIFLQFRDQISELHNDFWKKDTQKQKQSYIRTGQCERSWAAHISVHRWCSDLFPPLSHSNNPPTLLHSVSLSAQRSCQHAPLKSLTARSTLFFLFDITGTEIIHLYDFSWGAGRCRNTRVHSGSGIGLLNPLSPTSSHSTHHSAPLRLTFILMENLS